jgi:hypothetical protein
VDSAPDRLRPRPGPAALVARRRTTRARGAGRELFETEQGCPAAWRRTDGLAYHVGSSAKGDRRREFDASLHLVGAQPYPTAVPPPELLVATDGWATRRRRRRGPDGAGTHLGT